LQQEDDGNWYLVSHARGDSNCTQSVIYWQTRSSHGPDPLDPAWSALENLPFFLSGQTYFDVLSTNDGSPYYLLAAEYVAAFLNSFHGADLTGIAPALADAAALFSVFPPADTGPSLTLADRDAFIQTAHTLALFNSGALRPGSCTPNCIECCDAGSCDGGSDGGRDGGSDGGITLSDPAVDPGSGGNGGDASASGGGGCSGGRTETASSSSLLGLATAFGLLVMARGRRSRCRRLTCNSRLR